MRWDNHVRIGGDADTRHRASATKGADGAGAGGDNREGVAFAVAESHFAVVTYSGNALAQGV